MKNKAKTSLQNPSAAGGLELEFEKNYSRYYWLLVPVLTLVYFFFSYFSSGFYQDDEIAHYINMRDFWSDPWIIMSNWGKPGWKIFFVLPSLLGYKFVLLFNSLITALTAYFTILLAKELKLKNSIMAGIFFAFQPLILQLSFRSYAEIFTGLLIVLSLYFYFKKRYVTSALICGLAFTTRQETALLCLILAVFFVIEKKYIPIVFLGVFPLLLNLLGFFHTGDILWAWSEMRNLGEFNLGIERSFFHYFEVYIYITGPIVLSLFIIGLFTPFVSKEKYKTFFKREILIYIFFFTVFLFQCYLVIKGTNPGSWRYLLQVSPLASVIALIGFNELLEVKNKTYSLGVLIIFSLLTLLFFSKESTGLIINENAKTEYVKLGALVIMLFGAVFLLLWTKQIMAKQFLFLILFLTIGFSFYAEKPKQQSPENVTVDLIANWYNKNISKNEQVLYNHSLILFYGNIFGTDKQRFKILNMKSLEEAPDGAIIVWDSHYSYRPEYKNDVKLEYLQNNSNFKLLNQFVSPDRRFGAFIFQKQSGS